ncbi:MAG: 16S rRNA (cytosine(967)-C(5))-methyltransferase RsmB [Rhodocyclaceae bacterium]|nr:16S rRNA (cytosine(967)-C(5))-methyltransferase RsmB [Rhodocyclaceae bacterium]
MSSSRRPPPPALPNDSLAASLLLAGQAVAEVLGGSNLTEALARTWQSRPDLAPANRGAVQDLAYGALRRYGRGDFFLGRLLSKPLADPLLRAILLCALYRLETRPEEGHTTVDQAVEAAGTVKHGAFRGLANGVLRNFMRQREALQAEVIQYGEARWQHPLWWIARLRKQLPDAWQGVLEAGNGHPPMALRANRRRISPEDYLARLTQAGVPVRLLAGGALVLERPVPVERLPGFADGLASVQDAGAQRAAEFLDVADGMRVLDACSAPGGKTAHLLERGDLDLTALDADPRRLVRVGENLSRLGLSARTLAGDCRDLGAWWDGRPFQRILADVPCSASGVARRHPDIKWLRREADIAGFAATQAAILDALWQTLAPDGKMLYATCSVFSQENELQVAAFARRHPDCRRLSIEGEPAVQLLPDQDHDGFFYALLQKAP